MLSSGLISRHSNHRLSTEVYTLGLGLNKSFFKNIVNGITHHFVRQNILQPIPSAIPINQCPVHYQFILYSNRSLWTSTSQFFTLHILLQCFSTWENTSLHVKTSKTYTLGSQLPWGTSTVVPLHSINRFFQGGWCSLEYNIR